MKHRNKKLRQTEARIKTTGIVGELNLTERELLIVERIVTYCAVRFEGIFNKDANFTNFDKKFTFIEKAELEALYAKFKRISLHIREIHDKSPEQIALFNIQKQEERESAQQTPPVVIGAAVC